MLQLSRDWRKEWGEIVKAEMSREGVLAKALRRLECYKETDPGTGGTTLSLAAKIFLLDVCGHLESSELHVLTSLDRVRGQQGRASTAFV